MTPTSCPCYIPTHILREMHNEHTEPLQTPLTKVQINLEVFELQHRSYQLVCRYSKWTLINNNYIYSKDVHAT